MKLLLPLTLVLLLSACAGSAGKIVTVHQRVEAACVSAGTAYGIIAAVNNVRPINASQQAQVLKAKAIVDPRCELPPGGDYPYSMSEVLLSELEGAASTLEAIKGVVK